MSGSRGVRLETRLDRELSKLDSAGLRRRMEPAAGIDFASNDFLGLAADAAFATELARRVAAAAEAGAPLAAPATRFLRGHLEVHERLEKRLARFKGAEAALLLPSGWQATSALFGGLLRPEDRVLSDALNDPALIDGLRTRSSERVVVPHFALEVYARELARGARPHGHVFVVVESLYGMEGDLAPLAELARLCLRFGASLVVDEGHATGLYGDARGSGWIEACGVEGGVSASVTAFGKALAAPGGAITGSRRLIELLAQRARPFVYSTAFSPLGALAVEAALDAVLREPGRRHRAHGNARRLRGRLADAGLAVAREGSPIVPVVLGDKRRAVEVAERVRSRGFDVRAVGPPAVPMGTARLRLAVHADHAEDALDGLAAAVIEEIGRSGRG